jgi:hypothetical protein
VLKDADLILIVSRIQRAVNDRAARTLLNDNFRRQVFMDGRVSEATSSLAFVCTQTDLLNRRELAINLKLDEETATKRECALARNVYSTRRIKEDFRAGLREVALAAAADEDEEAVALPEDVERRLEAIKLPVFCCSSREAMALSGLLDEAPSVFTDVTETGIPQLQSFLYFTSVKSTADSTRRLAVRIQELFDNIQHQLNDVGPELDNSQQIKSLFDTTQRQLLKDVAGMNVTVRVNAIANSFSQKQVAAMQNGVVGGKAVAEKYCEKWVQGGWREGLPLAKRQGGLHYSSFKALCRRGGRYKSPTSGLLDMNEELAEPYLSRISGVWETVFGSGVHTLLDEHCTSLRALVSKHLQAFADACSMLGVRERVIRNNAALLTSLQRLMVTAVAQLEEEVAAQQREISRLVLPCVSENRAPMYSACAAESGTGTVARMRTRVLQSAETEFAPMYAQAAKLLEAELHSLFAKVSDRVLQIHERVMQEVALQSSALFEKAGMPSSSRDLLVQRLRPVFDGLLQEMQRGWTALYAHKTFAGKRFVIRGSERVIFWIHNFSAFSDDDDSQRRVLTARSARLLRNRLQLLPRMMAALRLLPRGCWYSHTDTCTAFVAC